MGGERRHVAHRAGRSANRSVPRPASCRACHRSATSCSGRARSAAASRSIRWRCWASAPPSRGSIGAARPAWEGRPRLLPTDDGWMAVSLARPDDVALRAGLARARCPRRRSVGGDRPPPPMHGRARELVERARLLGLPAAVLGEASREDRDPPVCDAVGDIEPAATGIGGCTVVELGSLWAGPLCGALLRAAGATVVKVESTARPDGARRGPPAFFDLLNAGKRSVALDLSTVEGVRALTDLVAEADVVIEASRPARPRTAGHPTRPTSSAGVARRHGSRSPGTAGAARRATGWRSVTTPPWPEASSCTIASARCSAPTPSPTRSRVWSRRAPPSTPSRPAGAGCSTSRSPPLRPSGRPDPACPSHGRRRAAASRRATTSRGPGSASTTS